MSTSANDVAVDDVAPLRLGEVLAVGVGDRAQRRLARAQRGARLVERGAAVARARVLEPAVDHRDHRAGARPLREQAQQRRLDERQVAREQRRPARGSPSAPTPASNATSGPAPGGSSWTAGSPLTPGRPRSPDRTPPTARAPRAPRASRRSRRCCALSVPMRRLAPPVSSTPAIWRMRATRGPRRRRRAAAGRRPGAASSRRRSSRWRGARATRRCARSCRRRSTRVTTSALWLPSTNVSTSMLLGHAAARLARSRTRRAWPR